jgi:hypothetical protein
VLTCQLTKLETACDQVKKAYPKLGPTDAALVASALSLAGRHAIAVYEGEHFEWPTDFEKLCSAMSKQMDMVQDGIEMNAPKKVSKTAPEEEPITVTVGLMPNMSAGEKQLDSYPHLKVALSDALQEGVEFVYSPSDIMWQWALDRANWNTVTGREISRRVKVKASFTEGAIGIELGTGTTRKRKSKAAAAEEVADEVVEEVGDVAEVAEVTEA